MMLSARSATTFTASSKDYLLRSATTFMATPASSSLYEDSTHSLGSDSVEMCSVLPAHPVVVNQPDVCLIDKRRSLERVPGSLSSHVLMSHSA
jgi:hypothetical protein